jgi:hypothetical protein
LQIGKRIGHREYVLIAAARPVDQNNIILIQIRGFFKCLGEGVG